MFIEVWLKFFWSVVVLGFFLCLLYVCELFGVTKLVFWYCCVIDAQGRWVLCLHLFLDHCLVPMFGATLLLIVLMHVCVYNCVSECVCVCVCVCMRVWVHVFLGYCVWFWGWFIFCIHVCYVLFWQRFVVMVWNAVRVMLDVCALCRWCCSCRLVTLFKMWEKCVRTGSQLDSWYRLEYPPWRQNGLCLRDVCSCM